MCKKHRENRIYANVVQFDFVSNCNTGKGAAGGGGECRVEECV